MGEIISLQHWFSSKVPYCASGDPRDPFTKQSWQSLYGSLLHSRVTSTNASLQLPSIPPAKQLDLCCHLPMAADKSSVVRCLTIALGFFSVVAIGLIDRKNLRLPEDVNDFHDVCFGFLVFVVSAALDLLLLVSQPSGSLKENSVDEDEGFVSRGSSPSAMSPVSSSKFSETQSEAQGNFYEDDEPYMGYRYPYAFLHDVGKQYFQSLFPQKVRASTLKRCLKCVFRSPRYDLNAWDECMKVQRSNHRTWETLGL